MDLHVFPVPIPPPTSLSTWFLWVFPVHRAPYFSLTQQTRLYLYDLVAAMGKDTFTGEKYEFQWDSPGSDF